MGFARFMGVWAAFSALAIASTVAGCSGDAGTPTDAGLPMRDGALGEAGLDAGPGRTDAGSDAGVGDAATDDGAVPDDATTPPPDASTDGATPPADGGGADGAMPAGDGGSATDSGAGGGDGGAATDAGVADGGPAPCTVSADCDDGIGCTVDSCDATAGACVHAPTSAMCGDGLFCNGIEACSPGTVGADPATGCLAGPPPVCDDGIACTTDTCDEAADSCTNARVDTRCADANFCNGAERCAPGTPGADALGCVAGTVPVCDDGIPCTTDTCSTATDACASVPNHTSCSDGAFCDGVEQCVPSAAGADAAGCVPGVLVDCDDGAACTNDVCDEAIDACSNAPRDVLCVDGLYCNGSERCVPADASADVRGCVAGAAIVCAADPYTCTAESCNEAIDACESLPDHSRCLAGEVCTASTGDPASGCTPGASCLTAADCDDSDVCTGTESCVGGICRPGTRLDCADVIACTDDTCDPTLGCEHTPDDAVCDNRLVCDGREYCDPVLDCLAGTPLACGDSFPCTLDTCSEAVGACVHTPSDVVCSNGRFCDGAERCTTTMGCVAGAPPSCADAIACTDDVCSGVTDACTHTPLNARCDNSAFCDGVETCNAATGCAAGTAVSCNDGVSCSVDTCNEAVDACEHGYDSTMCMPGLVCTVVGCTPGRACTASTAAVCDDGFYCNGPERCSSPDETPGVCTAGTAPSCDDSIACTIDGCSNATASCTHSAWDRDTDGYADAGCLGLGNDCNDLDPAVHPGAADTCDGIDNDCDGLVDGGRRPVGGACTVDANCCSGTCASGVCTLPAGSCMRTFDACTGPGDCCSGLCALTVDGVHRCQVSGGCSIAGVTCITAADCCSTGCVGGTCSDTTTCAIDGSSCASNAACCSNLCTGGVCQTAGPGCEVDGEVCSSAGNCCSGLCMPTTTIGVSRCATHDYCRAEGEICTTNFDCCTGGCDPATGRCGMFGSCSTSGEPCTSVRSCCSALCADAGSGVGICEHLDGCRPYGEVCAANYDCCSGECGPVELAGVRRCVNPPGCVDPGEICGQGGSDNCCVLRHVGCTPTGLGVSRCNDMSMCVAEGGECEFAEQCCSGLPCILDASGVRRCLNSCVADGGACLAHSDCCAGVCVDGFCNPSSGGCTPLGVGCTSSADCCSNICIGGICNGIGD